MKKYAVLAFDYAGSRQLDSKKIELGDKMEEQLHRRLNHLKKQDEENTQEFEYHAIIVEEIELKPQEKKEKKKTYMLIGVPRDAEKIAKYLRATPLLDSEVRRSITVVTNEGETSAIYSETKPDKELKEKVKQLVALIQA